MTVNDSKPIEEITESNEDKNNKPKKWGFKIHCLVDANIDNI